jgi:uncharacterized membrane protein
LQTILRQIAGVVATGCELSVLLMLGIGVFGALARALISFRSLSDLRVMRQIWVGFAGWILLALEFALAADIADTAISPTWDAIGQLAAIAAIRTVLNFYLARDVEKFDAVPRRAAAPV